MENCNKYLVSTIIPICLNKCCCCIQANILWMHGRKFWPLQMLNTNEINVFAFVTLIYSVYDLLPAPRMHVWSGLDVLLFVPSACTARRGGAQPLRADDVGGRRRICGQPNAALASVATTSCTQKHPPSSSSRYSHIIINSRRIKHSQTHTFLCILYFATTVKLAVICANDLQPSAANHLLRVLCVCRSGYRFSLDSDCIAFSEAPPSTAYQHT